jgi:UDP-GlcNAc:undecaprenyl-phosphate GlcNAc-1-phosphate transferase
MLPGVLLGCALMLVVGVVDDLMDLRAAYKLAGQFVAAAFVWWYGVRIDGFTNPYPPHGWMALQDWQSAAVTILWIVSITNTINLIDGLDGLAAGVSTLSAATLGLIAIQIPQGAPVAALAAATCGAALGFLRHNFSPARIFMGDTGSQVLGMLLAIISIRGPLKQAAAVSIPVSIVVLMFALGVPVFDTTFAIVRRTLSRKPIYHADRGHLHHRLVDLGLTQKQAVMVIYAVSGLLCVAALVVFRLYRLV